MNELHPNGAHRHAVAHPRPTCTYAPTTTWWDTGIEATIAYEPDIDELVVVLADSSALDVVDVADDLRFIFHHEEPGRLIAARIQGASLRSRLSPWDAAFRALVGRTISAQYDIWSQEASCEFLAARGATRRTVQHTVGVDESASLLTTWLALHSSYRRRPDWLMSELPVVTVGSSPELVWFVPPPDGAVDFTLWPQRELVLPYEVALRYEVSDSVPLTFTDSTTFSVELERRDDDRVVPLVPLFRMVSPRRADAAVRVEPHCITFDFTLDFPLAPDTPIVLLAAFR